MEEVGGGGNKKLFNGYCNYFKEIAKHYGYCNHLKEISELFNGYGNHFKVIV